MQPTIAIRTVNQAPSRRPGRKMPFSPLAATAAIATKAAPSMAQSDPMPMAMAPNLREGYAPLDESEADPRPAPFSQLLAFAELLHRLVRQVVFAEPRSEEHTSELQ